MMNGITANDTLLFKDVVGDYITFINLKQSQESSSKINIYVMKEDRSIWKGSMAQSEYCQEVYRVLLRRFRNSEIAYDNVDDFLDRLWETIEIYAPNYFIRKSTYEVYLSLSDKDLIDNGMSISNFVEHTDDAVDDVWEPIKTLTNQNQSKDVSGIAGRLRQHIASARHTVLKDFLKQFNKLFLSVNTHSNYYG